LLPLREPPRGQRLRLLLRVMLPVLPVLRVMLLLPVLLMRVMPLLPLLRVMLLPLLPLLLLPVLLLLLLLQDLRLLLLRAPTHGGPFKWLMKIKVTHFTYDDAFGCCVCLCVYLCDFHCEPRVCVRASCLQRLLNRGVSNRRIFVPCRQKEGWTVHSTSIRVPM